MPLVDTSVWIDHFRKSDPRLIQYLENGDVLCHPFVVGELALGTLKHRAEILALIQDLPVIETASNTAVLAFIESQGLPGTGIGWVDAHLLAAASAVRCSILTHDRRLKAHAARLNLAIG